jgi:beta-glucosidase
VRQICRATALRLFFLLSSICLVAWLGLGARPPAYKNSSLPFNERVDDLVGRMTLEEKVSQMQNDSVAIPRLEIPAYNWWNEGLHGIARSGYATVFPQAIGLAATWDTNLLHQVGATIATEARAKYNQAIRDNVHSIYYGLTIWSPNINIFRDPRWGRGQETYGEDPYLTGRLAVDFIRGLQGDDPKYLKTIATPKHFAVHSGPESSRHSFNVKPSSVDLQNTYLPAFHAAIVEGHADSLMCAYNSVDGVPACANQQLLETTLRKQWGFRGFITSDCGAVSDFFTTIGHHYSPDAEHAAVAAVQAGTDTTCGTEFAKLVAAVKAGLVSESVINTAVKRLFLARFRLGLFDPPEKMRYAQTAFTENDSPQHRALSLQAANKSMVLLKNEQNLLPLKSSVKTIAVIGPNAASLAALEGNYNAVPSNPVLPIDGIQQEFASSHVLYAQGAPYADGAPLPVSRNSFHPDRKSSELGLAADYFNNFDFQGAPAIHRVDRQIDFDWNSASPGQGIPAGDFSVRWSGTFTPPKLGNYRFGIRLAQCYPCSSREAYAVFLDGKQIAAFSTDEHKVSHPNVTPAFDVNFKDTLPHEIHIDYSHHSKLFGAGISLTWQPPQGALLAEAIAAAHKADVVIAVLGLSPDLEGEEVPVHVEGFAGGDRTRIELPAAQEQLMRTVGPIGKPLVVVLMNGSAIASTWANQHAQSILEAWYPGEAGGQAIAETLSGKNNPAGRLPVTFYSSTEQLPSFDQYSMKERTYRFFTGQPLFPFGSGLSYTNFSYSGMRLSSTRLSAGTPLTIDAEVKNDGALPGDEVVQVYLSSKNPSDGSLRSLRGFERLSLAPGESKHLRLRLSSEQLSSVDSNGARSVQGGEYVVSVGGSQPGKAFSGLTGKFSVIGSKSL